MSIRPRKLFAEYGIPVPSRAPVDTAEEAVDAAKALGGDFWVVKAQIHAGGRGKAGGVKLVKTLEEVRGSLRQGMAGHEDGDLPDRRERPAGGPRCWSPRHRHRPRSSTWAPWSTAPPAVVFMASTEGGVEIEKVAKTNPDAIQDPQGRIPAEGRSPIRP
jgi:succinyl-CoA synthetase beta subunit